MKKAQLFLLHFAGGNCYSYQAITALLKDFDIFPIELPGRGMRMNEKLLNDFDLAAKDIYNQITAKLNASVFLIYGHSMGAYLGLRVAGMLQNAGISPAYLIVSGNAGPGAKSDQQEKKYLLGKEEFIEELKTLGGTPAEVLENKELFDFFEPILRADFEIAEKNELENELAVKIPLYAIMGSEEEEVEQITNWGNFTESSFKYEILEGDHFFIYKYPRRIAAILEECYNWIKRAK